MDSPITTESSEADDHKKESDSIQERALPKCVNIRGAVDYRYPTQSNENNNLGVRFDQVQIRRYPMTLGDNPACSIGAPVSLDWNYEELPPLDLEDFEIARSRTRRPKLRQLLMSFYQRERILQGLGHSPEELEQAEREVNKARWQRLQTKFLLPVSRIEEFTQSAMRKIKRGLAKKYEKAETTPKLAADL